MQRHAAVITLRATKLEEKQGRILKLVGGMLMLSLAAAMLVEPALMTNVRTALLVFAAAAGATLLGCCTGSCCPSSESR